MLSAACSGGSGGGGAAGSSGLACTPSPTACPDGCNPCTRLSDSQVAPVVGQSVPGQWNSDVCEWDFSDAYWISIVGPAGKAPPFTDTMVRGYEKALALDSVANL